MNKRTIRLNKWVILFAVIGTAILIYFFIEDARQLTSGEWEDSYASFSPDGKNIVFVSDRSGTQDIWTMDRSGKNALQIVNWTSEETYPSWSPDGESIAFTSNGYGNPDIWIINMSMREYRPLITNASFDWHPSWSPDGELIAFCSIDHSEGNGSAIWITHISTGEKYQITQGRSFDKGPALPH